MNKMRMWNLLQIRCRLSAVESQYILPSLQYSVSQTKFENLRTFLTSERLIRIRFVILFNKGFKRSSIGLSNEALRYAKLRGA